ncbi:glycogen synthase GlgA [Herbaspirillum rhizosphaerae]|uniref:glycogen synthase GlgA n=1 Tax=Herbaspirillum rhizosphaerae TaxID=346179 RepID=UPI00067D468B|nr:glycogen synthase GlgA [Herbaspirillum rhizosphaerae]
MQARVLLVSSEAVPLVKTGGLADVITALAVSLRKCNIDASILMPGYAAAIAGAEAHAAQSGQPLTSVALPRPLPGGPGRLLQGVMPGTDVPVLLLDTERFSQRRANPYIDQSGQEFCDNAICFSDLAHAAVAICTGETSLPAPHVVHANDWHAGLIPFLLKTAGLHHIGSMLTIHNLAFQGNYHFDLAAQLGLAQMPSDSIASLEYWGKISYLKAGIQHADCVTTVSKTYAAEILTPRFGYGMEGVLNARRHVLRAIPNGIDSDVWDPQNDPLSRAPFSIDRMRGKVICKSDLQAMFGLLPVDPFAPILGIGSRMSHQKMADVALQALPAILDRHERMQLVVLGCGERSYEEGFADLAQRYPGRVGVHIGYDERRAHALHAGSDMLLHASRFEPFGLTPLYSMRYGTIPIASRVGGLTDTIADAGMQGAATPGASGVLFDGEAAQDMEAAVQRAFDLYGSRSEWQAMQRNAMQTDFDWQTSAAAYIDAYKEIAAGEAKTAFRTALQPKTAGNVAAVAIQAA